MTQLEQRTPSERSNIAKDTGTAESDENYDLVSVLYHCLKAADACTQYVADAEDAGDDERAGGEHQRVVDEVDANQAEQRVDALRHEDA
ncbi:MAG TPA: hypothetical protein VER04_29850, partial [Polyangiaceae bacterium]|nr:hypothetical protein [Polyangiaceae bacterium]